MLKKVLDEYYPKRRKIDYELRGAKQRKLLKELENAESS